MGRIIRQAWRQAFGALCLLVCLPVSAISVTLAWDANPEPDVTGYTLYYGNASRAYTNSTNVGNVTMATITGLDEYQPWYFAVVARSSAALESDFSEEVSVASVSNTVPILLPIADQAIRENENVNVAITVWDRETIGTNLTLTASSGNESLIPPSSIVFSGSGSFRYARLIPTSGQSGQARITITANDGQATVATSFLLTVIDVPDSQVVFRVRILYEQANSTNGPWQIISSSVMNLEK